MGGTTIGTTIDGSQVGYVGTLDNLGGFQTMTDAELFAVPFAGAAGTYPEAIDNSGGVVGNWIDEFGYLYGFIATPVPKGQQ